MRLSDRLRPFLVALAAALPIVVAACKGGAMSPEEAKKAVVVEAGASKVTGERLAGWLAQSPQRPTAPAASLLISTWLDAAQLDEALRKGPALDDSVTVDAVIGPDAARGSLFAYWGKRAASRPPVTDAQADSLADLDRVRVFQHIFIKMPPGADSATATAIVNRARAILKRARDGANFTALVKEVSEDSASKARNGFLPAFSREELPQQIAQPTWDLKPGEISPILGSGLGAHIVRRVQRAESREALKAWLAPRFSRRIDSMYIDSLTRANGLAVAADAAVRLRAMSPEPMLPTDGAPMVTWRGGALTPAEVRQQLGMMSPIDRANLAIASDSGAAALLREFGQRKMIQPFASPNGVPSAEARTALTPQYKNGLDSAKARIQLFSNGKPVGDAAGAYIDAILTQQIYYRPMPGALVAVLRQRYPAKVNEAALKAVLQKAQRDWQEKHANDPPSPNALPKP